jgi:SAM-dependent methyltransferase
MHHRQRQGPGEAFARFGRMAAVQLLLKGCRTGVGLMLTPVSSVRYFEFPFVLSCLPKTPDRCLDVSSPRLFSLYFAQSHPSTAIRMINPDKRDIATTEQFIRKLSLENVEVATSGVEELASQRAVYDCVWSISVVEHIAGVYDDRDAVRWMYGALCEGGSLILTLPVDRTFWEEFRDTDYYGTQPPMDGERIFFARWYDRDAIWERIVGAVGREPAIVQWFGEVTPGRFEAYCRRWMQKGYFVTVDDPREIADNYAVFSSWEAMPGRGVCGLMFEKRSSAEVTE